MEDKAPRFEKVRSNPKLGPADTVHIPLTLMQRKHSFNTLESGFGSQSDLHLQNGYRKSNIQVAQESNHSLDPGFYFSGETAQSSTDKLPLFRPKKVTKHSDSTVSTLEQVKELAS